MASTRAVAEQPNWDAVMDQTHSMTRSLICPSSTDGVASGALGQDDSHSWHDVEDSSRNSRETWNASAFRPNVAQRAALREQQRLEREALRQAAAYEREAKRRYAEARQREAEALETDLETRLAELEGLLAATLSVDDYIDLDALKPGWADPRFDGGALSRPEPTPTLSLPEAPSGLKRVIPGAKRKHEEAVSQLQAAHEAALADHHRREQTREADLARARAVFDERVAQRRAAHDAEVARVDEFAQAVADREPNALAEYFGLVLSGSHYPEDFPRWHRLAYVPDSRQLVIEFEFPRLEVIPDEKTFRYIKARDEITSTARTAKDRRERYASVLAQLSLRTVHELFEGDRGGAVETIVFNGIVDSIDPRTGQNVRPCLITLRTTRERFEELDLGRVDPEACLRHLSASVSRSPTELASVRPVLEFDMVDSRFVEESDILGGLDQRPNLMDLTPGEFESLITNLFEKMGLETRQTQASRDGGVDCVAYDPRPIFGGKVVIQAKRYKNTVGVSAVRDLYGTMQNEGASKGILVTTSGYGGASFQFADGKPLELLSGANLLYLLQEHAGIEARIEPPDEWVDPEPAMTER
jgi:restriction system protein